MQQKHKIKFMQRRFCLEKIDTSHPDFSHPHFHTQVFSLHKNLSSHYFWQEKHVIQNMKTWKIHYFCIILVPNWPFGSESGSGFDESLLTSGFCRYLVGRQFSKKRPKSSVWLVFVMLKFGQSLTSQFTLYLLIIDAIGDNW